MDEEQQHGKVIVQCREHEQKFNELRESMARIPTMTEWAEACEADNFETFKELVTRGRNARAIFEQCNMRLVAKIAYGYIDRGLELEVRRDITLHWADADLVWRDPVQKDTKCGQAQSCCRVRTRQATAAHLIFVGEWCRCC